MVDSYPGVYRDVLTYLNERIEEVLTGGQGADRRAGLRRGPADHRDKAHEIEASIAGIDGIIDDHVDLQVDVPQIEVEVDLAKARAYGLKPGDVRRAAATLVAGEEVGDIFRAGKAYDVVVWSTPETRDSVPSIAQPAHRHADRPDRAARRTSRRCAIAAGAERDRAARTTRGASTSRRTSRAATSARWSRDVETGLRRRRRSRAATTPSCSASTQERQAAQRTCSAPRCIAALAILLLLQASFGSWRLATLSFLTLPIGAGRRRAGGLCSPAAIVSLGSLVGFFTVFGIAARNGILLINHCQHLERDEGEAFGRGAGAARGARAAVADPDDVAGDRARAGAAGRRSGDRPGHEIEYPLAVVILGGLVTSTLLNLFVVPSLYLRFGRQRRSP